MYGTEVSRAAIYDCKYTDINKLVLPAGANLPESPHIYKKDGWYYLLIAEGGQYFSSKL